MLSRVVILVFMAGIVYSLSSALFYLVKKPSAEKVAMALTWRITLSIALFLLLFLGFYLGWLTPHGLSGAA